MRFIRDYIKLRLKFRYAARGIQFTFMNESSFRRELILGGIAIAVGFILHLNMIPLFICCGLIYAGEIINTSIEQLCDLYGKKHNNSIKIIKDTAAGAVLVLCITSVIVFVFEIIGVFL